MHAANGNAPSRSTTNGRYVSMTNTWSDRATCTTAHCGRGSRHSVSTPTSSARCGQRRPPIGCHGHEINKEPFTFTDPRTVPEAVRLAASRMAARISDSPAAVSTHRTPARGNASSRKPARPKGRGGRYGRCCSHWPRSLGTHLPRRRPRRLGCHVAAGHGGGRHERGAGSRLRTGARGPTRPWPACRAGSQPPTAASPQAGPLCHVRAQRSSDLQPGPAGLYNTNVHTCPSACGVARVGGQCIGVCVCRQPQAAPEQHCRPQLRMRPPPEVRVLSIPQMHITPNG
jgi:hypothetical protein